MSLIELLGLPDITFEVVGIPVAIAVLFFLVRHLLKSPVLIALINKRRDCHISDNEVRIAKLKADSKENLARINRTDPSDNPHLRIDRD